MCDVSPVRTWLRATIAAIIAAAAIIGVAAVLNNSVFTSWKSAAWMVAGAGVTALAVVLCTRALVALDKACACLSPRCEGGCRNLRAAINAIRVVLGIQATAALAAVLPALIPYYAQTAMYAIIGALLLQIPLVISALVFLSRLDRCADILLPETVGGLSGAVQH